MHERTINDEEIRLAFHSYTQLMVDLAMNLGSNGLPLDETSSTHNGQALNKIFLPRAKRLRQTSCFRAYKNLESLMKQDVHNEVSLGRVSMYLRILRLRAWPHSPIESAELLKILSDIDKFLIDCSSVEKLLYLMPQSREGVGVFAHALFSEDERVQEVAAKILNKIKKGGEVGRSAVAHLSDFFKYQLATLELK